MNVFTDIYTGLHLYISILVSQNKINDAIDVIIGPLGKYCKVEREKNRLLIPLLVQDHQYHQVVVISKQMLAIEYIIN